jgi:translation initiation factor IF-1
MMRTATAADDGSRVSIKQARHKAPGARAVLSYVGWVPVACVIAMIMTLAIAGITWVNSPYWGRNAQARTRNVGAVPSTAPAATTSPAASATPRPVRAVVSPNRIEIPKLGETAPIKPVGTTPDGELDVPLNPKVVGWWHYGAKPGAKTGTAILAGHVNYAGVSGSMAHIGRLNPGDVVYVFGTHNADNKTKVRFKVTGVRTYHKKALPYKQIFDQHSVGRIAIVTCGGPFDASTGNYLDNIVVFAVPA